MKILFIHNNYASNNSGEEHAAEALKAILIANGHQVKWFRRFSDVIDNSFLKKVQAFFLGIYNPGAVRELKTLLDDFKPDMVQVQNLYPFISPGIIKSIKRRGIPLVMRCPNYRLFCPTGLHLDRKGTICNQCLSGSRELNCIVKNCEDDIPKSIGYALRNFLARTFWKVTTTMDAYIVQTAFQRQKFIDNGIPPHKLFIIPGVTPYVHKISSDTLLEYVSFIGRVSNEKGIHEFIEVARLLPRITFLVAGSLDKAHAHLKTISPPNIIWKGFVSGRDLDVVFKQSKIVVVPSKWYEGFPNVITRAMKHGKPVVTSNLGAMADIVDHGENGLLVDPGDSVGLAKAVMELYDDKERCKRYGANAQKKATTLFTANKVYDHLMDLYTALLKEKERNTKKVLSILHYPPPVHGAAMVGQYIMESQAINTTFKQEYINLSTSVRVDEIGLGGWLKLKRFLTIVQKVWYQFLMEKPKLVYITLTASGAGFYKDFLIVLLAKLFKKKIIFHFHNKGIRQRQNRWVDDLLYKIAFKNAQVILLSRHLYPDIAKYVPEHRVHYCANGIPENLSENIHSLQKRNGKVINILFLSNLIETKGIYELLEACRILKDKGLIFALSLIGGKGDVTADMLKNRLESLRLTEFVSYEGKKFGLDKEKAYLKADVFVHPTLNDCFPLVLLEAMQFALPILSTFEGGIPDIVKDGETGFLVEQQNTEALAEKLELLIKNEELRLKMGQAGRKHYEEHFTLRAFENRFHKIMENLVS